jgi:peptidoglycan/xylan/chitin deacetylase (PgdA/CDA1 family)
MNQLLLIQPNRLLMRLYPEALWHAERDSKTIYLTFDDGPVPVVSEWVLDQLKAHSAAATFFCVGDNIQRNPAIFERIRSEGHLACNHTMYHSKGFKKSMASYIREVEQCNRMTGNRLFRPPYGQLTRAQYKALLRRGYEVVFWDVISYDFENITPEKCASNVIKNAKGGSIVLFHDSVKAEKNLRYALPRFLEHYAGEGYTFSSLRNYC